jgi:hypothetical protein
MFELIANFSSFVDHTQFSISDHVRSINSTPTVSAAHFISDKATDFFYLRFKMTEKCNHDGCLCDNSREELFAAAAQMILNGNCMNCLHPVNLHQRSIPFTGKCLNLLFVLIMFILFLEGYKFVHCFAVFFVCFFRFSFQILLTLIFVFSSALAVHQHTPIIQSAPVAVAPPRE